MKYFLCLASAGLLCIGMACGAQKQEPPGDKIDNYRKTRETLAAADRTAQWVALWRDWLQAASPTAKKDFLSLIQVLPPPENWPSLRKALRENPDGKESPWASRFLAATLENLEEKQWQALSEAPAFARTTPSPSATPSAPPSLVSALATLIFGGPQGTSPMAVDSSVQDLLSLVETLAVLTDNPEQLKDEVGRIIQLASLQDTAHSRIKIPDLFSMLGEKQAANLLTKILTETSHQVEIAAGSQTMTLARSVALQNIDRLKAAQWELLEFLDPMTVPLFQAMKKRFPAESDPYRFSAAFSYYLVALVLEGKSKEAAALILNLYAKPVRTESSRFDFRTYRLLNIVAEQGAQEKVWSFLNEILDKNPGAPIWNAYRMLGAQTGNMDAVLKLAERWNANAEAVKNSRGDLPQELYYALLASGKIQEAKTVYREAISALKEAKRENSVVDLATKAAQAARLLEDQDWFDECIRQAINAFPPSVDSYVDTASLIQVLMDSGRKEEALVLAKKSYDREIASIEQRSGYHVSRSAPTELIQYVGVLFLIGENNKIIALLKDSPYWGASDLTDILTEKTTGQIPLGYIAAAAFEKTDSQKEARRILEALVLQGTAYDPAYEMLIATESRQNAMEILDRSIQRNRFEERPLIWKAELLRKEGNLAAAETAIREAIAIDPSDGETGRDRRMKAYQVWAAISRDKGDTKNAEFLANVDKAIRLSEQADRFINADLLGEGIDKYKEALGYFSDAYCIQSRLAIQLANQGKWDEAEAHFQKAYELMPDSFGRIESHCFGCEKAFQGERQQSIAEKAFLRILEKNPHKPQIHYLLGYLRQEQHRYAEALQYFEAAVKLDPDYFNAWKHIQDLDDDYHLSRMTRDAAIANLYRLDPSGRHTRPQLNKMCDLALLWNTVAKYSRQKPADVLPLSASAAWLTKAGAKMESRRDIFRSSWAYDEPVPQKPEDALMVNDVLRKLGLIAY